jgi:hypothetical protein
MDFADVLGSIQLESANKVVQTLTADARLLQSVGVMDYSLLIVVLSSDFEIDPKHSRGVYWDAVQDLCY